MLHSYLFIFLDSFADYDGWVVDWEYKICLDKDWGTDKPVNILAVLGFKEKKIENMRAKFLVRRKG